MNDTTNNKIMITHFILLEFSNIRELQIIHVLVFLTLYLVTVSGNLLISLAIIADHHLHTPMFFFLANLAIFDLRSISVTVPKSIINSYLNTRFISYYGCAAQVFLVFFVGSDFALLTVMAHDRYVAICNPLRYETIMNRTACIHMIVSAWMSGLFYAMIHTAGTFAISFCSNIVDQYFFEIPHLLTLSCSNLYLVEIGILSISGSLVLSCFIFMITTYVQIFSSVLRMPSAQGRQKAFSTCIPHLLVVSLLVCTGIFAYLNPTSGSLSDMDLVFTIIYSVVSPLFNPLIYSLRNKEIKGSLWKMFRKNFLQKL